MSSIALVCKVSYASDLQASQKCECKGSGLGLLDVTKKQFVVLNVLHGKNYVINYLKFQCNYIFLCISGNRGNRNASVTICTLTDINIFPFLSALEFVLIDSTVQHFEIF